MRDRSLDIARQVAGSVRFSGDTATVVENVGTAFEEKIRAASLDSALRLSATVTPSLAASLDKAFANLCLPSDIVDTFVYSSAEVQAYCVSRSKNSAVISFSSALIDLLEEDEFAFVVGHELGHFLLGHGRTDLRRSSLEGAQQSRRQEISADRCGLIACGSLDIAVRALMKTLSGLSDRHLRFDVSAFLAQLREGGMVQEAQSSHPSIILRCRSLLWFSLVGTNARAFEKRSADLDSIDSRIERDVCKYSDNATNRIIDRASTDLELWLAAEIIVKRGRFTREMQMAMDDRFGASAGESLKKFLGSFAAKDVVSAVEAKLLEAERNLSQMLPSRFRSLRTEIAERVPRYLFKIEQATPKPGA